MSSHRILLLHSYEDSKYNLNYYSTSPKFSHYEFEICGVIQWRRIEAEDLIIRQRLLERLKEKIYRFKPDILLVHTGIAFEKFPRAVTSVLVDIKFEFPHIRIGLQGGARNAVEIVLLTIRDPKLKIVLREKIREDLTDDNNIAVTGGPILRRIFKPIQDVFRNRIIKRSYEGKLILQILSSRIFEDSEDIRELIKQIF